DHLYVLLDVVRLTGLAVVGPSPDGHGHRSGSERVVDGVGAGVASAGRADRVAAVRGAALLVGVVAGCTVLRYGSTAPVDRFVVVASVDRVGLRSTDQRVVAVLTVDGQRDGGRGRGARGPRTTHRVVA